MHKVIPDAAENCKKNGCGFFDNQSGYSVLVGPVRGGRQNLDADSRKSYLVQRFLDRPSSLFDRTHAAVFIVSKTAPITYQANGAAAVYYFKYGHNRECGYTAHDQANDSANRFCDCREEQ